MVVAMARYLGNDFAVAFLERAVMSECRIAAKHLARMCVHHAAANRFVHLKSDFIKSLQHTGALKFR